MKEKQEYENPHLRLVFISNVDIITTSEIETGSDGWEDNSDVEGWI